jgi:hypothetical protein
MKINLEFAGTMKPINVSVDEFCRLVGCKKTKAWAMIREREVVVCRLGRRTTVNLASIERLVTRNSTVGAN